jgi:rhamnosyltransferase
MLINSLSTQKTTDKPLPPMLTASSRDSHTSVGLVIPTLNAGSRWTECLEAVKRQSLVPHRLLIVDSESDDQTTTLALAAGFEIVRIRRSDFNHGGTRQWAIEYLSDCDVIVFLTQDAILASADAFEKMASCFVDPKVAVGYGRQIPHAGATLIESHARIFNYGPQSFKKNIGAISQLGAKVFFCSNSFAAYSRNLILKLGGFRRDLILGEDMEFAARAVKDGYTNMYCADAVVFHSHDYSVMQVLARYFDIGVFDAKFAWMREEFGSHRGEGVKFVASELKYLKTNRGILEIPRALAQTVAKLAGYRLGRLHRFLPRVIKQKLTTVPGYWAQRGA